MLPRVSQFDWSSMRCLPWPGLCPAIGHPGPATGALAARLRMYNNIAFKSLMSKPQGGSAMKPKRE